MTTRMMTILGFVLLFGAAGLVVLWTRIRSDRWASFGQVVAAVTTRRNARFLVLVVWAWLGWHFLAR